MIAKPSLSIEQVKAQLPEIVARWQRDNWWCKVTHKDETFANVRPYKTYSGGKYETSTGPTVRVSWFNVRESVNHGKPVQID